MQETVTKRSADSSEPVDGSVTLCIRLQPYTLNGRWAWNLQSTAVYCSDVMDFPPDFEGTKGIIHPDDLPNVGSALQVLQDGEIAALDFRLITTYGEVKTISGRNVSLDKSERREREPANEKALWEESLELLALRKEAEFLQHRKGIADATEKLYAIGSFAINKSTGEAWYSDGLYRLYGLPPQSLNHHANTFHPFLHPDDRLPFLDAFEAAFAAEVPVHLEYRIISTSEEPRTVRLVSFWSHNSKGEPIFTGILRDMTEDREKDDRVAEAQSITHLHQQVLKFSEHSWNTGYWYLNLVTRKTTYSDNYYRLYGLKPQTMPSSNTFLNLVHPDDRLMVRGLIDGIYSEHLLPEAEFRIVRPDGRQRLLKQSGKLLTIGDNLIMVGVVQDLTVQRGLEKKVADLNEKLALHEAIHQMTEGLTNTAFITWHTAGHTTWSDGFFRLAGFKPGAVEPSSRLLHKQLHPADLKAFKDAEALVTNGQAHDDLRFRMINRNGVRQLSVSFHRLGSGEKEVVVGVVKDLTREEALHRKLADTAHYAETLHQTSNDILLLTDTENTVLSWNKAAEDKTGIKATDAIYSNLFDLFPALLDETYMGRLHAATTGAEVKELKARNLYLRKAQNYFLTPLKNEAGEVTRVLHVVQDVSRELDLQQQLTERLAFIERLVEASVDRIVVLDRHMNYIYWNKQAEDYYALSKSKVIGRNILEIFPGLRNDPSYGEFRKVLRGETVYQPPVLSDDSTAYFETYLIPVKDERNEVTAILWTVHDLSNEFRLQQAQRKAQQQLEEEHRLLKEAQAQVKAQAHFLQRITETSPDMMSVIDIATGETSFLNREAFSANGFDAERMLAMGPEERHALIYPDDQPFLRHYFASLAAATDADCQTAEYRAKIDSGEWRWFSVRGKVFQRNSDGKPTQVLNVIENITERKKAEEEVLRLNEEMARRSEDRYLALFNAIDEGFYQAEVIFDEAGKVVDILFVEENPAAVRMMRQTFVGKTLKQINPGYETHWFELGAQVVLTGESRRIELYSAPDKKWFNSYVGKVGDGSRQISIVFQDFTDHKKAEEALRKSEEKYRTLFETIEEAFCIMELVRNEQGDVVDVIYREVNKAFERHTGLINVVGKRSTETIPNQDPERFKFYQRLSETGETTLDEVYINDVNRWLRLYRMRLGGPGSNFIAAVFEDITERKQRELNQEFLLHFSDALRQETTADAVANKAIEMLFHHLQVDRCYISEVFEQEGYSTVGPERLRPGALPMTGVYQLSDYPETMRELTTKPLVINDADKDPCFSDEQKTMLALVPQRALMVAPLRKGPNQVICALAVAMVTPRNWTEAERLLLEDLAERTWAAVERAKREEALRESEAHLRRFSTSLEQQVEERAKALQESAAFVEEITQTTPDRITIHDAQTREILYTNYPDFWKELYGDDAIYQSATAQRALGLVHPDEEQKFQTFLGQRNNLTDSEVGEIELRLKGDKWVRIRSKVFKRDEHGTAAQIISFTTDITEQKKSELEHQTNLAILQHAESLAQMGSWEYEIATGKFSWSEGMYTLFDLKFGTPVRPETYLDFSTEEDRVVAKRIIKNLKKANQPFEETMHIRKNNHKRLLKIKGSVVYDEQHRPQRIVGVDLDITNIKEAEERVAESRHWLQQTALASPDAISVYDLRSKQPVYLNSCLANWIGTTSEDLVSMGIDGRLALIHSDDRLKLLHFNEMMKAAKDGEVLNLEYRIRTKQDSLLWVRNRSKVCQRNAKGEVTHLLSILQDVTDEKEAGEILKRLNASLERKNQELEQKNDEITSFAFVASHDLKEPLRKIHTFSDWILTKEEGLSETGRQHLERMNNSVKRLDLLIDDILTLTKVHVDNEKGKTVDLNALLQRLQEEIKEKVQQSGAVIEIDGLPKLRGAENQLFYLFKNLISNAIKFQPQEQQSHIRIWAEREGLFTKIFVADNGIGIAAEFHKKIFEMFRRLHGRTEYEGTGMGLAICKKIMEKHGGKITVESEEGKGATFTCWFPAVLFTA